MSLIRKINLKYQHHHGMKNLNYVMDQILYQIFKIILNIIIKFFIIIKKTRGKD